MTSDARSNSSYRSSGDSPLAPGGARLEVFHHLLAAVAEEMGAALQRSAFSPNVKERRDFSCALFDGRGRLVAQAAHVPVHLGLSNFEREHERSVFRFSLCLFLLSCQLTQCLCVVPMHEKR